MKTRRQTRYFAASHDMTSPDQARRDPSMIAAYGTCPVWAQGCRDAGLAVAQETVLVTGGQRKRCDVPGCNDSHLPVPPPWTD